MKVREVSAGTTAQPNADFVELQMVSPGQTNVSGHVLRLYDAAGTGTDCILPTDITNGADNARILFGTVEYENGIMVPYPDFSIPPLLHADGGAVCFESIDCVSWGSFSGSTTSPAGTPFPGGIPPDQSIDRKELAGDPQDTGDSASDFEAEAPSPISNTINSPARPTATCQPAPPTSVVNLKAKVKGGRATITGQILPPAPGEKVSLTFFANGSPLRKIATKSATLNPDSKFKKRFKVPSDSTRCKVKVAFMGSPLGKKKFKC